LKRGSAQRGAYVAVGCAGRAADALPLPAGRSGAAGDGLGVTLEGARGSSRCGGGAGYSSFP
jgi:hypothetical protein